MRGREKEGCRLWECGERGVGVQGSGPPQHFPPWPPLSSRLRLFVCGSPPMTSGSWERREGGGHTKAGQFSQPSITTVPYCTHSPCVTLDNCCGLLTGTPLLMTGSSVVLRAFSLIVVAPSGNPSAPELDWPNDGSSLACYLMMNDVSHTFYGSSTDYLLVPAKATTTYQFLRTEQTTKLASELLVAAKNCPIFSRACLPYL